MLQARVDLLSSLLLVELTSTVTLSTTTTIICVEFDINNCVCLYLVARLGKIYLND